MQLRKVGCPFSGEPFGNACGLIRPVGRPRLQRRAGPGPAVVAVVGFTVPAGRCDVRGWTFGHDVSESPTHCAG
jgi:hypothetical protein